MEIQKKSLNEDYLSKLYELRSQDSGQKKFKDFYNKILKSRDIDKLQGLLFYLQEFYKLIEDKDEDIKNMISSLKNNIDMIKYGGKAKDLIKILDMDLSQYLKGYTGVSKVNMGNNIRKILKYCIDNKEFDILVKYYEKIVKNSSINQKQIKLFYNTLLIITNIVEDNNLFDKDDERNYYIGMMLVKLKEIVADLERPCQECVSQVDTDIIPQSLPCENSVIPPPPKPLSLLELEFNVFLNFLHAIKTSVLTTQTKHLNHPIGDISLRNEGYNCILKTYGYEILFGFNIRKTGIIGINDTGFYYNYNLKGSRKFFVITSEDLKDEFRFEHKDKYAEEILILGNYINLCIYVFEKNKNKRIKRFFYSLFSNPFTTNMLKLNLPNFNEKGIKKVKKLLLGLFNGSNLD